MNDGAGISVSLMISETSRSWSRSIAAIAALKRASDSTRCTRASGVSWAVAASDTETRARIERQTLLFTQETLDELCELWFIRIVVPDHDQPDAALPVDDLNLGNAADSIGRVVGIGPGRVGDDAVLDDGDDAIADADRHVKVMFGEIGPVAFYFGRRVEVALGLEVAIQLRGEHDAETLRSVLFSKPVDAGIAFLAGAAPVRRELEERDVTLHLHTCRACRSGLHVQPGLRRDGSGRRADEKISVECWFDAVSAVRHLGPVRRRAFEQRD